MSLNMAPAGTGSTSIIRKVMRNMKNINRVMSTQFATEPVPAGAMFSLSR